MQVSNHQQNFVPTCCHKLAYKSYPLQTHTNLPSTPTPPYPPCYPTLPSTDRPGCELRPTCQSWQRMSPPLACTAAPARALSLACGVVRV